MFSKFKKTLKNDFKNKKKRKASLYFLFLFLFFFIIFFLLFSKTFIYQFINYFYGFSSFFIVKNIFIINSSFVFDSINNISTILISTLNYPVFITFLCTGVLELSLIFAAIVSSFNFSIKKRLKGLLLALLVVIVFNIFRISITILIITKFNLALANFMHGFLFRLFLVIIVIGTYYFWTKKIK